MYLDGRACEDSIFHNLRNEHDDLYERDDVDEPRSVPTQKRLLLSPVLVPPVTMRRLFVDGLLGREWI